MKNTFLKINLFALIALLPFLSMGQLTQKDTKNSALAPLNARFDIEPSNKPEQYTVSSIGYRQMQEDFSEFTGELGDYNVDLLNKTQNFYSINEGVVGEKAYFHLQFGMGFRQNKNLDSIQAKAYNFQYDLTLGYVLLNTNRFYIIPNVSFLYNATRLRNGPKEKSIKLDDYVAQKELQLYFHQLYGSVGLKTIFKFNKRKSVDARYAIALEGGYAMKLNQNSWLRSLGNKVQTNSRINSNNLYLGISFIDLTLLD